MVAIGNVVDLAKFGPMPDGSRRGDWMITATGRQFWPHDIRDGDIDIEDISLALANIARYNGHAKQFYSVAQHSLLVAAHVPEEHKLAALVHDAAEAYVGDMIHPLKSSPLLAGYRRLCDYVEGKVAAFFGVSYPWHPSVKEADLRMLVTEKREVIISHPFPWGVEASYAPYEGVEIVEENPDRGRMVNRWIEAVFLCAMQPVNANPLGPHSPAGQQFLTKMKAALKEAEQVIRDTIEHPEAPRG